MAGSALLRRFGVGLIAAAVLLLCVGGNAGALDVPQLRGRVNDYANMIPPDAESRIDSISRGAKPSQWSP